VLTPKQFRRRRRLSLILGAIIVAAAVTAVAAADDIRNTLDGSADASFEVMSLNTGGPDGTTDLVVVPVNGDGKNGCNLTGSTTLVLAVSSSNTAAATVTPASVTFDSCGAVRTLTVHPVAVGSSTISMSETSNTTGATFNLAPAAFTVNVAPPPNTPPTVSVTGVTHGANYDKGTVPAAGCLVSDTEDGLTNASSASTPSTGAISGPYSADGIGSQTVLCSYTDTGGLTTTVSATYAIVDPSAPSIGHSVVGTLGNNGWYTSDVSLDWNVSEPESPSSLSKTGCVDQNIVADQAEVSYSCSASSAGGSAGPVSVAIKRDASDPDFDCGTIPTGWQGDNVMLNCTAADVGPSGLANPADTPFTLSTSLGDSFESASVGTNSKTIADNAGNDITAHFDFMVDRKAPEITDAGPTPSPNLAGWHKTAVTNHFSAVDSGSGLGAACQTAFPGGTRSVSTGTAEGRGITVSSGACADAVGHENPGISSAPFNIDRTAPNVVGAITSTSFVVGGTTWYRDSAAISWAASDPDLADGSAGSGLASGPTPGSHTVGEGFGQTRSSSATDVAGNSGNGSLASINVDASGPTISASPSRAPEYTDGSGNDWWKDSVSFSVSASDPNLSDGHAGSGLNVDPSGTYGPFTTGGTFQKSAEDNVGHTASSTAINYSVDVTAPTFDPICAGEPFVLNSGTHAVSIGAYDLGGSGLDAGSSILSGSVDTSTVGDHAVTYTAQDNVGHIASKTCHYYVQFVFAGFFAPVDKPNTLNVSKAGQAIPLKWRLTDALGNAITNLTGATIVVGSYACNTVVPTDLIEEYAAGSSGLQNLGDGYYQFNWKSPTSYANSCKTIGLELGEGAPRFGLANFNFKK
jgi:hypothetical protein